MLIAFKKQLTNCTLVLFILALNSCTSVTKMECDMPEGQEFINTLVQQKFLKEEALLLADKAYTGSTRGWFSALPRAYKEYLQDQMDQINQGSSPFLKEAETLHTEKFFTIDGIVTQAYDKEVNKCTCEATVNYGADYNNSTLGYTLVADNEGVLHSEFNYHPHLFQYSDDDSMEKRSFINELLASK